MQIHEIHRNRRATVPNRSGGNKGCSDGCPGTGENRRSTGINTSARNRLPPTQIMADAKWMKTAAWYIFS